MRGIKMGFDDLLVLRMTTEALQRALRQKNHVVLDRLHFTEFKGEVGDETLFAAQQFQVSARAYTTRPLISEHISKAVVKGTASIFHQSFLVEAECILYRHTIDGAKRSNLEPGHITLKYKTLGDGLDPFSEVHFYYVNSYDASGKYTSEIRDEMNEKEKVKLAIIATNTLPDRYVQKLFLDFAPESAEDLDEIFGCLAKHRPLIAKRLQRAFSAVRK